jgi:hypothetical protein
VSSEETPPIWFPAPAPHSRCVATQLNPSPKFYMRSSLCCQALVLLVSNC